MKGSRKERELYRELWDRGFAVMRAPASGGARKHPQPDLLVLAPSTRIAIECKASQDEPIYIGKDEVKALKSFCTRASAHPVLGIRFDWESWRFLSPKGLPRTEKSVKVTKDIAKGRGAELDDLVSDGS